MGTISAGPSDSAGDPEHERRDSDDSLGDRRTLLLLTLAAVVAAVGIGFIGGVFRWCLARADVLRAELLEWAGGLPSIGWLAPVVMTAAGALIGRALVGLVPRASGSGIQDVEAVWRGQKELPTVSVLPVKFFGGLAAIGSGMVLGREGPTVHMGSVLGSGTGRLLKLSEHDRKLLYTTVGGAGLAVAFNAPIGGALFALEEVTRSVKLRIVLLTIFSTSIAVACSRLVVGDRPDFAVGEIATPPIGLLAVFVLFGFLTGLLGVVYNAVVMGLLSVTDRMRRVGPRTRAGLIGAVVGLLLWFDPLLVGGGDVLTQKLLDGQSLLLWSVLGYLVVRFLIGPLCYAAGTPGGLFAPLLAVGALWGVAFHGIAVVIVPAIGDSAVPLAIVGMSAFFAATVRAPLTGLVLIIEMTATTTLTVPMLAACAAATVAAFLVKGAPVYDSLRERMVRQGAVPRKAE